MVSRRQRLSPKAETVRWRALKAVTFEDSPFVGGVQNQGGRVWMESFIKEYGSENAKNASPFETDLFFLEFVFTICKADSSY